MVPGPFTTIYCNHFSSDEMDNKLRNHSRDFSARFVWILVGSLSIGDGVCKV